MIIIKIAADRLHDHGQELIEIRRGEQGTRCFCDGVQQLCPLHNTLVVGNQLTSPLIVPFLQDKPCSFQFLFPGYENAVGLFQLILPAPGDCRKCAKEQRGRGNDPQQGI